MEEQFPVPLYMAPMAGITDSVCRRIMRRCGADGVYSEMVSSRGLYYGDRKTARLLQFAQSERPLFVQLFGNDPDVMAYAVREVTRLRPDGIDLNMGCPMPKIVGNGDGGALMKNIPLAAAVCRAAAGATDLPVSVKFRAGWDETTVNAPEFARAMEQSGAARLCIHARTVRQQYTGLADIDMARRVVESVKIPVTVSGDITDFQSAVQILEQTGAGALMIGRAALGDPWIFRRIKRLSTNLAPEEIDPGRRCAAALLHAKALCAAYGEPAGIRQSRKFSAWYLKGFADAARLRRSACLVSEYRALEELLKDYTRLDKEEGDVF